MATSLKIELGTQVVVTERYSRKIGIITKITKTGQFETSITQDYMLTSNIKTKMVKSFLVLFMTIEMIVI